MGNTSKRIKGDQVEGKELVVFLPEGYQDSNKRYPVVYMHDGQNLFSGKSGPSIKWDVDKMVDRLTEGQQLQEVIVVGIYNAGEKRAEEYIPYPVDDIFNPGSILNGRGREYTRLVGEKIVPYIDHHYRTLTSRENRAIMGSSLGGLISLWIANAFPELFTMVGALSPCAPWNFEVLEKSAHHALRVWIDAGTAERINIQYDFAKGARQLVERLIDQRYRYGQDLFYFEDQDAGHEETAWAKRVEYPFRLFKGNNNWRLLDFKLEVNILGATEAEREIYINPVASFDNGIKFSLYQLAEYQIREESRAKINAQGRLELNGEEEVVVSVTYQGIEKTIKVSKDLSFLRCILF